MNAFIILFDEEWQFYHSDHVGNGDHVSLKIKGGVKIFLKVQERIFLIFQVALVKWQYIQVLNHLNISLHGHNKTNF